MSDDTANCMWFYPWAQAFEYQQAAMGAWLALADQSWNAWGRLVEHQAKLAAGHEGLRRFHAVPPFGCDWFDLYGRRQHDVTVEQV